MNVIEFHDVHRHYGNGREVLAGINLDIAAGQVVGLLGRNGAGKTTLINLAMGMLEPQRGEVRVFDRDPRREPVEVKRRIGFVSEDQVLPPNLRVDAVVALHRDLFPDWDRELEKSLRRRFGFDGRTRVKTLSRGQARQLALLCAVAHRPELMILDEPAGSLDPATRREFLETSIQLLAESGTTILFSSHYMTDVERMADRVVFLDDARIVVDAGLDELREDYVLVVIPGAQAEATALARLPGFLRARVRHDRVHAVFSDEDAVVADRVREQLDGVEPVCTRLPLEELFVELLGESS